jgi:hypothetical protein
MRTEKSLEKIRFTLWLRRDGLRTRYLGAFGNLSLRIGLEFHVRIRAGCRHLRVSVL